MTIKIKGKLGPHFVPAGRFSGAIFRIEDGGVLILIPHYTKLHVKGEKDPEAVADRLIALQHQPQPGITDLQEWIDG